jgi:Trypsin
MRPLVTYFDPGGQGVPQCRIRQEVAKPKGFRNRFSRTCRSALARNVDDTWVRTTQWGYLCNSHRFGAEACMFAHSTVYLLVSLAALCGIGCSDLNTGKTATSDSNVIAGADAIGPVYDAVGSLSSNNGPSFCTGTLIAPSLVLTARHCARLSAHESFDEKPHPFTEESTIWFSRGHDSTKPSARVQATEVLASPLEQGGAQRLGSDVALYVLKTPILDVVPWDIAADALGAKDIGAPFEVVGYGVQNAAFAAGTRKKGSVDLSALTGSAYGYAFKDFSELEKSWSTHGRPASKSNTDELMRLFKAPLLDGYEAYISPKSGVQSCSGDSGGPLIRFKNNKPEIYAVASWGPALWEGCTRGLVYASFGPLTRSFLEDSKAARR